MSNGCGIRAHNLICVVPCRTPTAATITRGEPGWECVGCDPRKYLYIYIYRIQYKKGRQLYIIKPFEYLFISAHILYTAQYTYNNYYCCGKKL